MKHDKKKKFHTVEKNVDENLLFEFKKVRKTLLRMSLVLILTTLLSLAVVGLKIFYPFHLFIGIGLYIFLFIPIVRRIYLSRKYWKKFRVYKFSEKFFIKERWRLFVALVVLILIASFLWLRPLDENPLRTFSDDEIRQVVNDDLYKSVTAMDYLDTTGNQLLENLALKDKSTSGIEKTLAIYDDFLKAVSYSEFLTDKHRYFSAIPNRLHKESYNSFLISYSLYVKKYEIVFRIMQEISGDELLVKTLNEYNNNIGRGKIYNEMVFRFYEPKTRLRLSVGYLYMKFVPSDISEGTPSDMLYKKAKQSYIFLRSKFFRTITESKNIILNFAENKIFDAWFPIQKSVATAMGRTILSTRGNSGLITEQQATQMGKEMQPGDFMLQRRNWHLSNVGIPGFWTHSALYTGSINVLDEYFKSEFPYEGYESFSEFLKNKNPDVYNIYSEKDVLGYQKSVVEAIERGVVIQSLEKSADADFVVVLRPDKLSKRDKMLAIIRALENVGKPYDFNFDFDTVGSLVCSELIYDAYTENLEKNKKGINFETSLVSGRKMVSPLDMAIKFKNEYGKDDAELKFVYFIESNEKTGIAKASSLPKFLESLKWSKFTFLQNSQ